MFVVLEADLAVSAVNGLFKVKKIVMLSTHLIVFSFTLVDPFQISKHLVHFTLKQAAFVLVRVCK